MERIVLYRGNGSRDVDGFQIGTFIEGADAYEDDVIRQFDPTDLRSEVVPDVRLIVGEIPLAQDTAR